MIKNLVLTFERNSLLVSAVFKSIDAAETGSFGTDKGSSPSPSFTGKNTGMLTTDALVLAVQITDFPTAYADISSWNINILKLFFIIS